jgi:hypothetical protein
MTFQYVEPTNEQLELMQNFRDDFEKLTERINANTMSSRGRSICLTKLEECSFWLNKAITKND